MVHVQIIEVATSVIVQTIIKGIAVRISIIAMMNHAPMVATAGAVMMVILATAHLSGRETSVVSEIIATIIPAGTVEPVNFTGRAILAIVDQGFKETVVKMK